MGKKEAYKNLKRMNINGAEQWVSIRGDNLDSPLLLFLHGGPGGSEMATSYTYYGKSELEKNFIVVNWDQRGSGKSYNDKIDPNTMTIEQLASDGLELTRILLKEFGKDRLYLIGHSWGSILGIRMIMKESGLYHSFLGISQLVNMKASEQRSLDISIDLAQRLDHKKAIKDLQALKVFDPSKENLLLYMDIHRSWLAKLGGLYYSGKRIHPNMLFLAALFSPEYTILDVFKLKKGLKFSVRHMWSEIMSINLLNEEHKFDIPIYFIYGAADKISHPQLIEEYHNNISTPKKELIRFSYSGHSPHLDEREEYEKTVIRLFCSE